MATKEQQWELAEGLAVLGLHLRKPRRASSLCPALPWRIATVNDELVPLVEGTFAECSRFYQGLVYAGFKGD